MWDVRDPAGSATNGTTVFLRSDGTYSCQNRFDSTFFSCSLTFTNVATGAFTFANLADGATAIGTLDFLTGIASGRTERSSGIAGSYGRR